MTVQLTSGITESNVWARNIANRIEKDKLVPIVSGAACYDLLLGGYEKLLDAYTDDGDIKLARADLPYMSQLRTILTGADDLSKREDFIRFVKRRLYQLAESRLAQNESAETYKTAQDTLAQLQEQLNVYSFAEFSNALDFPQFGQEQHPLLILAELPLSIYITTGYHNFLEMALIHAGKKPQTDICRWHRDIEDIPSVLQTGYKPSVAEPLVYHLHGFDEYEDSLVLTEDDYLKFLVACTQNLGREADPIPVRIRRAMSESSLMILGYGLRHWDFRSLFWGLLEPRTRRLTSVVSIQLEATELEQRYYQTYFARYDFNVFWGSMAECLEKLDQTLNPGADDHE